MTGITLAAHLRLDLQPGACAHSIPGIRQERPSVRAWCPECLVVGPPAETSLAARDALLEAFPPGQVARCWACDGEADGCTVCEPCPRCKDVAAVFVEDQGGRRWCLLCALTHPDSPANVATARALATAAERAERRR